MLDKFSEILVCEHTFVETTLKCVGNLEVGVNCATTPPQAHPPVTAAARTRHPTPTTATVFLVFFPLESFELCYRSHCSNLTITFTPVKKSVWWSKTVTGQYVALPVREAELNRSSQSGNFSICSKQAARHKRDKPPYASAQKAEVVAVALMTSVALKAQLQQLLRTPTSQFQLNCCCCWRTKKLNLEQISRPPVYQLIISLQNLFHNWCSTNNDKSATLTRVQLNCNCLRLCNTMLHLPV